jgi:hypothetical protein
MRTPLCCARPLRSLSALAGRDAARYVRTRWWRTLVGSSSGDSLGIYPCSDTAPTLTRRWFEEDRPSLY